MGVCESDPLDPCLECIIQACCTKSCDKAIIFFSYKNFEYFQNVFFLEREKELISSKRIEIKHVEQKTRRSKK
jgi:hypothetical protein